MCLKAVRFMLESIISKMEQVKPERLEAFMSLLEEKKALFKNPQLMGEYTKDALLFLKRLLP